MVGREENERKKERKKERKGLGGFFLTRGRKEGRKEGGKEKCDFLQIDECCDFMLTETSWG
jgi:hypothetical protein